MDPVLQLARDLIAIPSVNPSLVPGAPGERDTAEYVAARLRLIGMDVEMHDALPGRPNVVGIADGRAPGPALMFCGHLDTVGVEGMDGPFDPVEREGRLYGRGAQDMKGGIAAMIHAAESVLHGNGLPCGRLIVAVVADEEYASAGAEALVARLHADAAVITEPTDLAVGVAHKGFSAAEVVMHGRAAHGSRPAEGRDAILRMGRVLAKLEAEDRKLQGQPAHPLLGTGSLHASSIEGGGELSSYPASCRMQFERRTLPGEPLTAAEDDLRRIMDELRADDPELSADVRLLLARPPYALDPSHPLALAMLRACDRAGCPARHEGLSFWTDAAILGGRGIATVLFGPGGAGLHGRIEYVRVDHLTRCRDVLVHVVGAWCGEV
ncbi:MAG TPA: M20/M25/M40 family metallo-hydrolase [Vicinamibacterales bacterium]|nr:M20/M25/M40 family metallo-hydrolase [Vicinamibacterales bacterium]